jgi:hypothetical protein
VDSVDQTSARHLVISNLQKLCALDKKLERRSVAQSCIKSLINQLDFRGVPVGYPSFFAGMDDE